MASQRIRIPGRSAEAPSLEEFRSLLSERADPGHAAVLRRFFKTGPGEYGERDRFLGIRMPVLRKIARSCRATEHGILLGLLDSPVHEERMLALLIFMEKFTRGDATERGDIYRCYLDNTHRINSWDLVDVTAPHIVGAYLLHRDRSPLYGLARSTDLWERRIGIVATFHFIRRNDLADTFRIAEILLADKEDLIHKAVGWMLREAGKRNCGDLEAFLVRHYRDMPRTMLRYAIERFPERRRQAYLRGTAGTEGRSRRN